LAGKRASKGSGHQGEIRPSGEIVAQSANGAIRARPSCPPLRKSLISPKSRLFEPEEVLAQNQLSSVQAKYDGIITQARRSKQLCKDLVAEVAAVHNSTKQLESILEKA